MNKNKILLIVALLVLGAAAWFGRNSYGASSGLITLDVRETPLADVLRMVEGQSHTRVRATRAVDAKITLRVKDKPLSYVLDRLSEQAGARWSTIYAVYGATRVLDSLEASLRGDGKYETAGWTRLAPSTPAFSRDEIESGPKIHAEAGMPEPPQGMKPGMMLMRRSPDGGLVVQKGDAPPEFIFPEALIIENSLKGKLGSGRDNEPSQTGAAEVARATDGKWTSYILFEKSSMGFGGPLRPMQRRLSGPGPGMTPGVDSGGPPPMSPDALPPHDFNDRFAKLTPQQRVERARERHGGGEMLEFKHEE